MPKTRLLQSHKGALLQFAKNRIVTPPHLIEELDAAAQEILVALQYLRCRGDSVNDLEKFYAEKWTEGWEIRLTATNYQVLHLGEVVRVLPPTKPIEPQRHPLRIVSLALAALAEELNKTPKDQV